MKSSKREKSKTFLLVEGVAEKEKLFSRLCLAYPEMNIKKDDIVVYGTNIHQFINEINREYGEDWLQEDIDIDVPFVITRKRHQDGNNSILHEEDFKNIYIIFDYERQDPDFSYENLKKLQNYFNLSSRIYF